jgi:hypothetical protein
LEINVAEQLTPALESGDMMLAEHTYRSANIDPSKPILQMPDFNSLIAKSQEHQVPIFELTPQQLDQAGTVLESTQGSQSEFEELLSECANKVIAAVDADRH